MPVLTSSFADHYRFANLAPAPFIPRNSSASPPQIETHYDHWLVFISFCISIFGSFTTLQLMLQTRYSNSKRAILFWVVFASITLGCCAVWSMHFIGMTSFSITMRGETVPILYEVTSAVLSAFVSCFSCGIGLLITTAHLFIPRLSRYLESQHRNSSVIGRTREPPIPELRIVRRDRKRLIRRLFEQSPTSPTIPYSALDASAANELETIPDSPSSDVQYYSADDDEVEINTESDISRVSGSQSVKENLKRTVFGDRHRPHILQILVAAIFTASGVCGMHFMGMASMKMHHIEKSYQAGLVMLSFLVAYIASAAALWLAYNMSQEWQHIISSILMAVAICGMHYIGQASLIVTYNTSVELRETLRITPAELPLYVVITTCFICFLMVVIISSNSRNRRNLEMLVENLNKEMEVSDKLLLNILPASIAVRMKSGEKYIHQVYENVTVVFADVCDFTTIAKEAPPEVIVFMLHELFSLFDEAAEMHGLEKIKTIGDAYLAVSGLPKPNTNHALIAVSYACEMIRVVHRFNREYIRGSKSPLHHRRNSLFVSGEDVKNGTAISTSINKLKAVSRSGLRIRVGAHSGTVVGGVVGCNKFLFDIFGATVNIASRMESTGIPMMVQVSEETHKYVKDRFKFQKRENVLLKGIGVRTAFVTDGTRNTSSSSSYIDSEIRISTTQRSEDPSSSIYIS